METPQISPFSPSSRLPTGRVLTDERLRLSLSTRMVAQRLRQHTSTVAAVERNNAVLPPGWIPTLRKLGMSIPEVVWPLSTRPYSGAQLKAEIAAKRDLRFSPFVLRKLLGVSEEDFDLILSGNRLVPSTWLLKLAELGLDVPQAVKRALAGSTEGLLEVRRVPVPPAPQPELPRPERPATPPPEAQAGSIPFAPPTPPQPAEVPRPSRERPELFFRWSQDGGIFFSTSESLLDLIPRALQALLGFLRTRGLAKRFGHSEIPGQDTRHAPR
jgi:hypothetical protein